MPPSCRNPHCQVAKTGACLEGIEQASKCSNYVAAGALPSTPEALPAPDQRPIAKPEGVPLPLSVAMTPEGTYEVTRGSFARVVIVAGEQRTGKTTLLASLYEAFQYGPLGTLAFAGSRTLHGYERRLHLSRCASGLERADTDRTKPLEGFQFLHLRIRETTTDRRTDLLFGDMSGELYKSLRDSTAECRKFGFIGCAHDFVVLLNGRKVELGEHAEAFAHVSALIRSLLDASVLGKHSRVTLLTTMWDLLDTPTKATERARIAEFEDLFRRSYSDRLLAIECVRSAARPEAGGAPIGIDTLLRGWLAMPEIVRRPTEHSVEQTPTRSFDTYARIRQSTSPWRGSW